MVDDLNHMHTWSMMNQVSILKYCSEQANQIMALLSTLARRSLAMLNFINSWF